YVRFEADLYRHLSSLRSYFRWPGLLLLIEPEYECGDAFYRVRWRQDGQGCACGGRAACIRDLLTRNLRSLKRGQLASASHYAGQASMWFAILRPQCGH